MTSVQKLGIIGACKKRDGCWMNIDVHPEVIGIDEVSIRKGHTYRIVVSDLIRRRPIWFGVTDRSEERMGSVLLAASEAL
jgi:transposase